MRAAVISSVLLLVAAGVYAANDLSLRPDACCVAPGEIVVVDLVVENLSDDINGVQVFLGFDESVLTPLQIQSGDAPWNGGIPFSESVPGEIDYFITLLSTSTNQDAVVSRFRFQTGSGGAASLRFREVDPPLEHKLTRYPDGFAITPSLHDVSAIAVTNTAGDPNGDATIDRTDLSLQANCLTGPRSPASPPAGEACTDTGSLPGCTCLDLDADGDIDLYDTHLLMLAAS